MATPMSAASEGGRVIDAVAGHGDDVALRLPVGDMAQLALGLHAGEHALLDRMRRVDQPDGAGDRHGGARVVAGHQHRADTGPVARGDGRHRLGADGVVEAPTGPPAGRRGRRRGPVGPRPPTARATAAASAAPPRPGRTTSGAPLVMTVADPSGRRCSVVIRRVAASNGSSRTRRWASRSEGTSMPASRAARMRDVSVSAAPAVPAAPAPEGSASLQSDGGLEQGPGQREGPRRAGRRRRPPPSTSRSVTMAPWVRVPVLSVARTVTDPRVSTGGSDRTTAPRALIRDAPAGQRQGDHGRQRLRAPRPRPARRRPQP